MIRSRCHLSPPGSIDSLLPSHFPSPRHRKNVATKVYVDQVLAHQPHLHQLLAGQLHLDQLSHPFHILTLADFLFRVIERHPRPANIFSCVEHKKEGKRMFVVKKLEKEQKKYLHLILALLASFTTTRTRPSLKKRKKFNCKHFPILTK